MNAVFVKLVNMSVAAGWLILAVLVLRLLLKKAPRWITCLLWAMVAVRLVCPISLQSPVSAYQVAAPAAVQKSGQVEYFHYVYESGDKPSIQLDVDAIRPAEALPAQPQTTPEQSAAAEPVQETAGRSDPTRYLPPLVTVWLAVGGALLRSIRAPEEAEQIRAQLHKWLTILKYGMTNQAAKGETKA